MAEKRRRDKWKVNGYYIKSKQITRWVALGPYQILGTPFDSWQEAFNYAYGSAIQEIVEEIRG